MIGTSDFLEKMASRNARQERFSQIFCLPRSAWEAATAHFALGVMVAGITVSSVRQIERIQIMRPGDKVEIQNTRAFEELLGRLMSQIIKRWGSFSVFKGKDH